jgi:glycosyltransferase involved in cell wall biosynthesis
MRLLISAYACEPSKGSEPAVGWNFVRHMSRHHELWVLTRENNRAGIEAELKKNPLRNVHWSYFDLPRWMQRLKKLPGGIYFYYLLWQVRGAAKARQLHERHQFQLAHHVTFVTYWMPSLLCRVSIPYIWGPVGGGEFTPESFRRTFSLEGRLKEAIRRTAQGWAEHLPIVKQTARQSSYALATTQDTRKRLIAMKARRISVLSQVAVCNNNVVASRFRSERSVFHFLSVGNLLHWKGFHLGIKAFAEAVRVVPATQYWIVGSGPERHRLEKLAIDLGVSDKITFHGVLAQSEALERTSQCDVLVHPSLHDSGGAVCLEAMSMALPVICMDLGGPALQVTAETGIKICATEPEHAVRELAKAMILLATNPELAKRMGEAGKHRAQKEFSWERKCQQLIRIYEEALQAQGTRSC